MENKKMIVANLKMNMDREMIMDYLTVINKEVISDRVIICPTSIFAPYFLNQRYSVGLQNTFYESKGAYTGEISPKQATSMNIHYTILGHSERRSYFHETDEIINKKVKESIRYNMKVILCIGETKEQRDMLKTDQVIKRQLMNDLNGLDLDMFPNIILAYEPVWAIGTGLVPTENDISKTISYIKGIVSQYFHYNEIPVLYGGSVNEKNIKKISKIEVVDGVLVGGSSTDAKKFLQMIEVVVSQ